MSVREGRPSVRRRDRHGRGLRGPLLPAGAPFSRSRAERFDGLVRDEVSRLGQRWGRELAQVEFAVEEVPPIEPVARAGVDPVPLAQTVPATDGAAPRIVVYRRPVEARGLGTGGGVAAGGGDERELVRLVRDLLVEEVAELLGLSPESVDPSYDTPDD